MGIERGEVFVQLGRGDDPGTQTDLAAAFHRVVPYGFFREEAVRVDNQPACARDLQFSQVGKRPFEHKIRTFYRKTTTLINGQRFPPANRQEIMFLGNQDIAADMNVVTAAVFDGGNQFLQRRHFDDGGSFEADGRFGGRFRHGDGHLGG